jgi:hypothetical protein
VKAASRQPSPLISAFAGTGNPYLVPFVLLKVWARKLLMLLDRKLLILRIFKSFWLETFSLPDSTTGAPAILAFLVVLRVLIKLFFSMLMMGSPLEILSDDFLLLSTRMCKAWEGPNSGRVYLPGRR